MALKKSKLYSSLWASCDVLRGGMDSVQYRDYVLFVLFIKYVSDKYAGVAGAPVTIPPGADFASLAAMKGNPDIVDQINCQIITPLVAANELAPEDFPDFSDQGRWGSGKEEVDRLSALIAIFDNPTLDFSKHRAQGDDILGSAYEYLLKHFAAESGKSKGQFYTPTEVSRIVAQIIGIKTAGPTPATTVYDPTCGTGSLLLKVRDEAGSNVSLYGQEIDAATTGLARMNMILHGNPTAHVVRGNTLADPKFKVGAAIKQFDFVVANPPFSDKRWSTGIDLSLDPYARFHGFGIPPVKQGDYAYLLHIVGSLNDTGTGCCVLPHGVLFRSHAEADIRRSLIRKGYIKGIIGLPANLFYGTRIPACLVVVDKKDAQTRHGIFMINASQGLMRDGAKNRLRSQDIHKIVDTFFHSRELPGYSRMVQLAEIEKNEFNLNLSRYLDCHMGEDRQDIGGHLCGGIPQSDVDALDAYWRVCPSLKPMLFAATRPGYVKLAVTTTAIRTTIASHGEFATFLRSMSEHFDVWQKHSAVTLKALRAGCRPSDVIFLLSEDLLAHYTDRALIDKYKVYQHLMDYWTAVMEDDCYAIAQDGWEAAPYRIVERDKKGKARDKGWACELIPRKLLGAKFFAEDQTEIDRLTDKLNTTSAALVDLVEQQDAEEGVFADIDAINKVSVMTRLNELEGNAAFGPEIVVLKQWLKLFSIETDLRRRLKVAANRLDTKMYEKCQQLTETETKRLIVECKWLAQIASDIHAEVHRITESLAERVRILAERYQFSVSELSARTQMFETKVEEHLQRLGLHK